MAERGASYADVAAAISHAVAAPLPFPGPGTERRGNGHDAGGAYSSAAV
jgi:hypothetical protein